MEGKKVMTKVKGRLFRKKLNDCMFFNSSNFNPIESMIDKLNETIPANRPPANTEYQFPVNDSPYPSNNLHPCNLQRNIAATKNPILNTTVIQNG
jgi:hypothetical protein